MFTLYWPFSRLENRYRDHLLFWTACGQSLFCFFIKQQSPTNLLVRSANIVIRIYLLWHPLMGIGDAVGSDSPSVWSVHLWLRIEPVYMCLLYVSLRSHLLVHVSQLCSVSMLIKPFRPIYVSIFNVFKSWNIFIIINIKCCGWYCD